MGGYYPTASGSESVAIGGYSADANAYHATVIGGNSNDVYSGGEKATIVGGQYNKIRSGANFASIVGGQFNDAYGYNSFLGGAYTNTTANGDYSFVFGRYLSSDAESGSVIGVGTSSANKLVNDVANSLLVGYSNTPDFRVQNDLVSVYGSLYVQDGVETNGTFTTHSPATFYGEEEGVWFGIDFSTKTFDWCQKVGRNIECDNNNVEILKKLNSIQTREESQKIIRDIKEAEELTLREEYNQCIANGYDWDVECYEIERQGRTRLDIIERVQINITEGVESTCRELNPDTFEVETYECIKQVPTGETEDSWALIQGCGFNDIDEYYCDVRVLRN